MLPGMFGTVGGLDATSSLREVIHALGLTSNLKVLLDAGDAASYDGSSQTWTDISGGGYSFFRGSTSSSQSVDPTFSGTSGGRSSSEYFSFDGGDYFTLNQSNPSWVNDMHQSGATWTIAEWVRVGTLSNANYWGSLGDGYEPSSPTTGVVFGVNATLTGGTNGQLSAQINASSSSVWHENSSTSVNASSWNFVAISANLSSGAVAMQVNGTSNTSTKTFYGTPSTGNAPATLNIGAVGSGGFPDASGQRLGQIAIWSSALTAAQLSSLFQATRNKYGI